MGRIGVSIVVAVGAWAWVRGAPLGPAPGGPRAVPGGYSVITSLERGVPVEDRPDAGLDVAALAAAGTARAMTFGRMGAEVAAGGQVTVTGWASVYSASPDAVYVWSLRIFGDVPGKKPLLREHHYEDRATWMVEGQTSM